MPTEVCTYYYQNERSSPPQLFEQVDEAEKHFRDMQDLEFTIEDNKLYILQTRNGKRTGLAALHIVFNGKDAVELAQQKDLAGNRSEYRRCLYRTTQTLNLNSKH